MFRLSTKNFKPRATGSLSLHHLLLKVFCAILKTAPVYVNSSNNLNRWQWLGREQGDILVILITLPLISVQHELGLLDHLSLLRRLHIHILNHEGLILLHLLLHPHLVHERVGRVQRAQVLRPIGLNADQ